MAAAASAEDCYKIVLVRHGQSEWNASNQFTGWTDVGLTELGLSEAKAAGELIKEAGFKFDTVFTSVLKRAIQTMWEIMKVNGREWAPVTRMWQLNERHYGALQGLNKSETAAKHGKEQVHIWRRSYDIPPPALGEDDERHPSHDPRYTSLTKEQLPATESLSITVDRVVPAWEATIVPAIQAGKTVLIAAHGNSLRALVKYLDDIDEETIPGLNIPTGVPLVYELNKETMKPIRHYYLGDPEEAAAKAAAVAAQANAPAPAAEA